MASVVGKTIFSDGKGKLYFGYYKDDDGVTMVDYKTWKNLGFKDVSKGDTNKERVIKAILKNQKQFNKKVEFNMWAKQKKRTFEETMDWFIQNGWINNINKGGIKESIDVLSVNEAKFKIKHTITKKEWNKTHKDYKSVIDGVHYVMKMTDKGSALVPVNISESSVNEKYTGNPGDKLTHKYDKNIEIELIEPTNRGWKVYQTTNGKRKIAHFDKQDIVGGKSLFESVNEAKFGYKDSTSSYINNHKDEYKIAEKINKGNEMKFYDDLQAMEDKIGHPKTMLFISNALRGYGVDMYKDPKIKNPADAQEALFLLSK